VLFAAAAGAIVGALQDDYDRQYVGRQATPPANPNELTSAEFLKLDINYVVPPSPGTNYPIGLNWNYMRETNLNTYTFTQNDTSYNLHYLKSFTVKAPAVYDRMREGGLPVSAQFVRPDGTLFVGSQLHVRAIIAGPDKISRVFPLYDNGTTGTPNDGWYYGTYNMLEHEAPAGVYYLLVIAQEVNLATEGLAPVTAAGFIGGLVVTPQLTLSFDATPCRLNHDAVIIVV